MLRPTTAGLLRRPGNPGTKGKLLAKSLEAYLLALETINRLTITYRIETFCTLSCNAWELLLKAKILDDTRQRASIYYPAQTGQPARSLSLRDCLQRVFPNDRDSTRRNVERVEELRDAAIHLFISEVPKDILGLLQACVLNYHHCLSEWFGVVLSERIPIGMMTIVFDASPERLDLSNAVMRRRLGRQAADYLIELTRQLQTEHEAGRAPQFSVQIEYKLAIQKNPQDAALVAVTDPGGTPTALIEMPRDPARMWPFRQGNLVDHLNANGRLPRQITRYDIQAIDLAHSTKGRWEWFYQGSARGSPGQYSRAYADWIEDRSAQDAAFLTNCRERLRAHLRARRNSSAS